MKQLSDAERLAVVETKIDTVLRQQSQTIEKLDSLLPTFATKADMDEMDRKHTDEMIKLGRKHTLSMWVLGICSMIFSSIITLLIAFFVSNIGEI